MPDRDLGQVSTYFLMIELLNDGDAGVLPDLEPLSRSEIVGELSKRRGGRLGEDIRPWLDWFFRCDGESSEVERANLASLWRTKRFESSLAREMRDDPEGWAKKAHDALTRMRSAGAGPHLFTFVFEGPVEPRVIQIIADHLEEAVARCGSQHPDLIAPNAWKATRMKGLHNVWCVPDQDGSERGRACLVVMTAAPD